jgi:hypothetical protein
MTFVTHTDRLPSSFAALRKVHSHLMLGAPSPASNAGSGGARPDHSISGHAALLPSKAHGLPKSHTVHDLICYV